MEAQFFSCLLAFAALVVSARAAERPPNIILIVADDLGAKELSCYGSQRHRTPHLDRMAAEGMRFETFYAMPLCTPTRVALMTGQYGFHNGYLGMSNKAFTPAAGSPQSQIGNHFTHADLLKSAGYATALAGKWQLKNGTIPALIRDAGFDEYRMWAYDGNLPRGVTHPAHEKGGAPSRYWQPDDFGPDDDGRLLRDTRWLLQLGPGDKGEKFFDCGEAATAPATRT